MSEQDPKKLNADLPDAAEYPPKLPPERARETGQSATAEKQAAAGSATRASEIEKEKHDLEAIIQPMLVGGVALSSGLMLFGLLLGIFKNQPVPAAVPSFDQVLPQALQLQPGGVLAVGLLVLIATPILRVAASVIAFLYERDWLYALITFIVFLIVLSSILLGRG